MMHGQQNIKFEIYLILKHIRDIKYSVRMFVNLT
jgi:hypothetical protein